MRYTTLNYYIDYIVFFSEVNIGYTNTPKNGKNGGYLSLQNKNTLGFNDLAGKIVIIGAELSTDRRLDIPGADLPGICRNLCPTRNF